MFRSRYLLLFMLVPWLAGEAVSQSGQWQRISYNHPATRTDLAALTFQGKIWVTGGFDSYPSAHGDLWTSLDGSFWNELMAEAPWGRRFGHTLTEYDGVMWVVGGAEPDDTPSGIWKSPDGVAWTEIPATAETPFPDVVDHATVAFNDKLWVIGGLHNWTRKNWVWNTADGAHWTDVTESQPAPWVGRSSHACVVLNGRIYLAGGYTADGAVNDVWCTDDGSQWMECAATAPWSARWGHTLTVYQNELWLIGGYGDTGPLNDVWHSADGVVWTQTPPAQIPWAPRSGHAAYVLGDQLWIIGGYPNDSWYYDLLSGWQSATLTPPPMWEPRVYHDALVFDERMWLVGGARAGLDCANIYASDNGRYWHEVPVTADPPMFPRTGHTVNAHDNAMWILGGTGSDGDVWRSTDGSYWEMAVDEASWGPRSGHSSIRFQDKLWIIGGNRKTNFTNHPLNDIWSSYDGYTWNRETASAPWSPRFDAEAVVFNNQLWLFGGRDGDELFGEVWTSDDGVHWNEITTTLPWDSLVGHAVAVYENMLWVIGGAHNGTMVMDNQVWMTRDGVTWNDYERFADVPWNPRAYHDALVFNNALHILGGFAADPVSVETNEVWAIHSVPPMPLSRTAPFIMVLAVAVFAAFSLRRTTLAHDRRR